MDKTIDETLKRYEGFEYAKFENLWNNYVLYYEGEFIPIDAIDQGAMARTAENVEKGIQILRDVYATIKPMERQIYEDIAYLKGVENVGYRHRNSYAVLHLFGDFCKEYHKVCGFRDEIKGAWEKLCKEHPPIVGKPQQNKKKGRTVEVFKSVLVGDDEALKEWRMERLHKVIDGKKGKEVARLVLAAIESGWISRPTYTQMKEEFGEIGSKTGYNRYLEPKMYTEAEKLGAKNALNG